MDSSKDFAKSKRKATKRHPGRGGRGVPGPTRSSGKSELGSNVERYQDEDEVATSSAAGAVVPKSQGADLTLLLHEQQTEFRQRGTFHDDVQPLPTTDTDYPSTLDLNIDLQALATSLSNVPLWTVLDIDAALCQSCLSKHDASLQHSAHISSGSEPNDGPPEDAVQPSTAANSRSPVEAQVKDSLMGRSTESISQPAAASQPEATTTLACPAPAAESTAKVQTQHAAPALSQVPEDHSSASFQRGGNAAPGKADIDDLDALLNASIISTKPQHSLSSASKSAPKQQESLEDWLDSL